MRERSVVGFLRAVYAKWSNDWILSHGAALAYYAIFSLAPLLVLLIAVGGFVLGRDAVQTEILRQIEGLVTPDAATMVEQMITRLSSPRSGVIASVVSLLTMLLGATSVLGHLQSTMNLIWEVPPAQSRGLRNLVRQRMVSLVLIVGLGVALLGSMALTAVLAAFTERLEAALPGLAPLIGPLNFAVPLLLTWLLLAMVFRVLPHAAIAWRDVWIGAAVSALLFAVGQTALGLYLGRTGTASVYGAASALVFILVWIYYSAQIFFLGAEVSAVYATWYGSRQGDAEQS